MSSRVDAQPKPLATPPKEEAVAPALHTMTAEKSEWIQRFSLSTRIEHWAMALVFTTLVVTGLPQKYATMDWAQGLVSALGGIAGMRTVHRIAGWVLTFQTVFHLGKLALYLVLRKGPLHMLPRRKDFTDAIGTLKYYLGKRPHHPPYDRYEYKQKFEYWGMLMGTLLMVVTGFVLLYPIFVATVLPAELIPAAKAAHSNEGLMAMLVIVVWHIFNAVLSPDVFPIDTAMFTGKISRERMEKEHAVELARMEGRPPPDDDAPGSHGPPHT